MDDATRTPGAARHVANRRAAPELDAAARASLPREACEAAQREIASWPGYAPTPLVELPGLARAAGLGAVLYKDEAHRFGLGSFKALGGAFAVMRALQTRLCARGVEASREDLLEGRHPEVRGETVACATDGNHGRSVAWGAETFGCRCRVYIHAGVSTDREAAIAAYGAEMVRLPGDYDASVRACAADAEARGWTLVADTDSGGGSPEVPRLVMQGYSLIVREALEQLGVPPTHVFVPAGVGGLAAAVAGHWTDAAPPRPRMVSVEPLAADCVLRALATGAPQALSGDIESFMACLSAGEVSPAAWPVLACALDDAVAIPDAAAIEAMRGLADGRWGDAPLVSGESGCAPVAAVLAAAADPGLRDALGLGPEARVLAIGSEGATAPELWARVVGRRPEEVGR